MTPKPERWRVEPSDAIGVAIRIPVDKLTTERRLSRFVFVAEK